LSQSVLGRWVREANADPTQAFPGRGQMKPDDAEVARLKRELAKTKAERLLNAALETISPAIHDRLLEGFSDLGWANLRRCLRTAGSPRCARFVVETLITPDQHRSLHTGQADKRADRRTTLFRNYVRERTDVARSARRNSGPRRRC